MLLVHNISVIKIYKYQLITNLNYYIFYKAVVKRKMATLKLPRKGHLFYCLKIKQIVKSEPTLSRLIHQIKQLSILKSDDYTPRPLYHSCNQEYITLGQGIRFHTLLYRLSGVPVVSHPCHNFDYCYNIFIVV